VSPGPVRGSFFRTFAGSFITVVKQQIHGMKRKTDNFSKFYEKKKKNGAIKEAFRQEKKAAKKERKEAIERHFEDKRRARAGGTAPERPERPERPGSVPQVSLGYARGTQHPAPDARSARTAGKPPKAPFVPKASAKASATTPPPFIKNQKPAPPQAKGKSTGKSTGPGPAPNHAAKSGSNSPQKSVPHPVPKSGPSPAPNSDLIPLNKYIAHGGVCSRRDAAELIRHGKVTVNGQPVSEPGTRVAAADLVKVNGKKITMSRNFVYILLNKPKDYITTTEDPQGRKTVLDLIRPATTERVYPVGRLDRNTSGVLLLTNDGDLAQKLAHPSHEVKKIYHVTLDKVLTKGDFDKIIAGVTLDDGLATVDVIAYADAKDKTQVGLEIHSGRNRIVRRIFEQLGYDVRGLDRVTYAGLTKKNVQRGKWRLLTEKEIRILKYLNSSVRTPAPGRPGPQGNKAGSPTTGSLVKRSSGNDRSDHSQQAD
jgi:23S rRNA pseudouridine2605 synthase